MKFMRRTNPPGGGTVVWMQSSLAAGRAEGAVRCVQKFRVLWRGGATRRALKIEANQPISLRVASSAPISRHVWYDKQSYGVVLRVYRGAGIRIGVDRVCFVRANGKVEVSIMLLRLAWEKKIKIWFSGRSGGLCWNNNYNWEKSCKKKEMGYCFLNNCINIFCIE